MLLPVIPKLLMGKKKSQTTKRAQNSETLFGVDADNPETLTELASRIRECAKLAGSGDALGQKAAIPRRTLETYLAGNAEPKLRRGAQIASVSGVRLEWLATGEGPMRKDEGVRVAPLDRGLLRDVLQGVEELQVEVGGFIEPEKKAELIELLYEEFREREGKVDRARILKLVKLAS